MTRTWFTVCSRHTRMDTTLFRTVAPVVLGVCVCVDPSLTNRKKNLRRTSNWREAVRTTQPHTGTTTLPRTSIFNFFFVGEWTGSINRYQYETFISIRHRHKGLGGNGTGLAIRSGLSVKVVVAFPTVAWNVEHPVASLLCHRAVTTCLHKHDQ